MLLIITSTGNELFSGINIADLELPKYGILVTFLRFSAVEK